MLREQQLSTNVFNDYKFIKAIVLTEISGLMTGVNPLTHMLTLMLQPQHESPVAQNAKTNCIQVHVRNVFLVYPFTNTSMFSQTSPG